LKSFCRLSGENLFQQILKLFEENLSFAGRKSLSTNLKSLSKEFVVCRQKIPFNKSQISLKRICRLPAENPFQQISNLFEENLSFAGRKSL
jgi:hypothetical protein